MERLTNDELEALARQISGELQARLAESDDPQKGNLATRRHMRPETAALHLAGHGVTEILHGIDGVRRVEREEIKRRMEVGS